MRRIVTVCLELNVGIHSSLCAVYIACFCFQLGLIINFLEFIVPHWAIGVWENLEVGDKGSGKLREALPADQMLPVLVRNCDKVSSGGLKMIGWV